MTPVTAADLDRWEALAAAAGRRDHGSAVAAHRGVGDVDRWAHQARGGRVMSDHARVAETLGALYSPARRCRKRRRCDGHLTDRHWIEVGDPIYWSALPPDSEIGNRGWWHAAYCQDCAPIGSRDEVPCAS